MLRSQATLEFYDFTAGKFIEWLTIRDLNEVKPFHVRSYLAGLNSRGLADRTVHGHARGIRAFLNFCHEEGYIDDPIVVKMPKVRQKRLPMLTVEELNMVLAACRTPRNYALLLLLADTGLRLSEAASLAWGDMNIGTGLVRVRKGKGGKERSVVIGAKTRRAILKYRRTIAHDVNVSVFNLKRTGMRTALYRIGQSAGVHLTSHMIRRTFATLTLKSGGNLLYLQAMMGHESLEQTRQYIRMFDDVMIETHAEHGPVDKYLK
jgi:integrase/recombinase XerD